MINVIAIHNLSFSHNIFLLSKLSTTNIYNMSTSTMFKNSMTLAKQTLDENASIYADIHSKMTAEVVVRNRSYKFVLMTDVSILSDTSRYITLDTNGKVHCLHGNHVHAHMNNMKILVETRKVTPTYFLLQHWKNNKKHRLDVINPIVFYNFPNTLRHDKTFDEAMKLHDELNDLWVNYDEVYKNHGLFPKHNKSSSTGLVESAHILQKNMDKLQNLYIEMNNYLKGYEGKPKLIEKSFPQIHPILDHVDSSSHEDLLEINEGNEELLRFIEYRKGFYKISKSKVYSEVVQMSDILEMIHDSTIEAPTNLNDDSVHILIEEQEVYDIDVLANMIIQREFKHYMYGTKNRQTFHTLDSVKAAIQKFHLFMENNSNDRDLTLNWRNTLQDIHHVLKAVVDYTNNIPSSYFA